MGEVEAKTGLEILDEDTCWELLETKPLGRLAASVHGRVELFPMNYAVHDNAVYFRSAPGTKLDAIDGEAVFEADEASYMMKSGWSVIAWGTLEEVTDEAEREAALQLPLRPWSDTPKPYLLKLVVSRISGRRLTHAEF
jgi:uncharacterized protein